MPNSRVCSPIITDQAAQEMYLKDIYSKPRDDQLRRRQRYADFCVQEWGYTLASTPRAGDSTIIDAVIGACEAPWKEANDAADAARSQGEPLVDRRASLEQLRRKAAFYVIQGRAGHCSPDP